MVVVVLGSTEVGSDDRLLRGIHIPNAPLPKQSCDVLLEVVECSREGPQPSPLMSSFTTKLRGFAAPITAGVVCFCTGCCRPTRERLPVLLTGCWYGWALGCGATAKEFICVGGGWVAVGEGSGLVESMSRSREGVLVEICSGEGLEGGLKGSW